MKHLLRCLLLILMPAVVAYGEARQIQWISILRPAVGTEANEVVQQITWSDGIEEVIVTPRKGAPAAEYRFDLESGTYTSKITRSRMKAVANVGNTHEVCDPFDEQSCTPSAPETTMGTYYTYGSADVDGLAMASIGLMPCRGDKAGQFRLDYANWNCQPGTNRTVSECRPDLFALGQISATPAFGVTAGFAGGTTACGQRVQLLMGSDGILSHSISGYPGHTLQLLRREPTSYFDDPCGTVMHETGGGGGDDTDPPDDPDQPDDPEDPDDEEPGSGDSMCAAVYDGQTGNYLGTCCGTTLEKIIKCAMEIK